MSLLGYHLDELRASGLTDATVEANGIYSETDSGKLAILLRHKGDGKTKKHAPAMVFPFIDLDGHNGYYRVKWDRPPVKKGKPEKYASPCDLPNQPYFPKGISPAIENADQELVIGEGEKKALAAMQAGFPCIGLVGVYGWKSKGKERPLPELERVVWKGRKVYIAFDSDRATNPDVQKAEARLAFHLAKRGAVVKLVILPDGPADSEGKPSKVGLDDYLVANGADAFRKLLAEAIDPPAPDAVEQKRLAQQLDPCEEVEAIVKAETRDGVPTLRFWRGTFWRWSQGRYAEVQNKEISSRLVGHLNLSASNLTRSIISNHVMQLEAQTLLTGSIEPPAWLGSEQSVWQPIDVLACRNGLVHLPSYFDGGDYLREATPKFFNTAALSFDFNPDAGTPANWESFINRLWDTDRDSIDLLREFMGYTLTPDTRQHKILLIVGPPRSGKGTVARILRELVGRGNVAGPTLSSLGTNFGLWPLLGKTLAIISDARLGSRSDAMAITERLLSISGEDALTIDRKNLEPVTTTLATRFVILTNELPRLNDSSGALANRMIVLRLTKSWLGKEDHGLTARLLTELPAILLWAITGWRRLRERGRFEEPGSSAEMREQFNDLTSPLKAFVRDCCNTGMGEEAIRGDLYKAYKTWAETQGMKHTDDQTSFGRHLRAAFPAIGDKYGRDAMDKNQRWYVGIGLKV